MPIYEYRCEVCGARFEKYRRMKDADAEVQCPRCESAEIERLMSSFATGGCGPGARFT